MIEIEGFLDKNLCDYCVDFFEKNKSKTQSFHNRKLLSISPTKNSNKKIINLINKFSKLYPNHKIANFEILKWPVGEFMDWHDDTIYYDKTTITYLNEDYEGGRTTINDYTVEPKIGKIILFDSNQNHKVSTMISNNRYVLLVWYSKIK
tara:strand:- start:3400 stop:3846 length:447 start_codon:yes stop_codon:yes gene_type:complete